MEPVCGWIVHSWYGCEARCVHVCRKLQVVDVMRMLNLHALRWPVCVMIHNGLLIMVWYCTGCVFPRNVTVVWRTHALHTWLVVGCTDEQHTQQSLATMMLQGMCTMSESSPAVCQHR
jgi:hypothetical protein